MKQIQITTAPGENFTPAGLMQRYAKQTPGVEFSRGPYFTTELVIEGTAYQYHHLQETHPGAVVLYLCESARYKGLNPMCRCCLQLDQGCEGTTCQTWTGCVHRKIRGRAEA